MDRDKTNLLPRLRRAPSPRQPTDGPPELARSNRNESRMISLFGVLAGAGKVPGMHSIATTNQRKPDPDEKPTLLKRALFAMLAWLHETRELLREARNERWARKWLNTNEGLTTRPRKRAQRDDTGNADIIGIVIAIAVFVALIPFIAQQITAGQGNLTSFTGASALLGLVPLILVAVLILRMWRGHGGKKRSGGF